jgi:hypothetical protein
MMHGWIRFTVRYSAALLDADTAGQGSKGFYFFPFTFFRNIFFPLINSLCMLTVMLLK